MISSRHEIADRIRKTGKRATPQRIIIYEAMWKSRSHPTVADVHSYAIQSDPSISLATVYKTLHLFEEIGLASEFVDGDGTTHYDPETRPHINLICERCGKIEDFEAPPLSTLASDIESKTGFKITSQTFEIRGICPDCQRS
ncbi:MAG: transcriptional repressor [Candidatus Thorarchaeota archaeon]|nr:transcriptional repressor [Candidatus Thorarchaeota archaeon]